MPVYNSFDFVRSENQNLLPRALDAILAQTYKNFELIIMDNQSIDDTPTICGQYAKKDPRIRFIVDSEKRYPEAGIGHAATFRRGAYTMVANDDDSWHPSYIETLLSYMEKHPEADMCYSNGIYIDIHGNSLGNINRTDDYIYHHLNSPLSNFSNYILKRNPIPLAFGLFRSEAYSKTLPFEDFDELKANVDNLFVAKFFLLGLTCHYIDKPLFSYRKKERALNPKKVKDMPDINRQDLIGLYFLKHQINFGRQLINMVEKIRKPTEGQRDFLTAIILRSLFKHTKGLATAINTGVGIEKNQEATFARSGSLYIKTATELEKKWPQVGNFKDDNPDNIRFEPILNIRLINLCIDALEGLKKILSLHDQREPLVQNLQEMISQEFVWFSGRKNTLALYLSTRPAILTQQNKHPVKNETKPRVSIITASFNLAPFVEETMHSVANQTGVSFEHIVIDGGSTDDSLSILKRFPHIKLVSEKDTGYPDAFWKGLKIAKGDYIMQCAISDAYANSEWVKKCVELMDANKNVSLVWGLPARLTEKSIVEGVARPQFHYNVGPEKERMFNYWLKTTFFYPEGNLCARRSVMMKCYPPLIECTKNILDWLEFSYCFNRLGYLSAHIPVIANYGRTHGNQMGEQLTLHGSLKKMHQNYIRKVWAYRLVFMLGMKKHTFIDHQGNMLGVANPQMFMKEYIFYRLQKIFAMDNKYLQPENYIKYFKKRLAVILKK